MNFRTLVSSSSFALVAALASGCDFNGHVSFGLDDATLNFLSPQDAVSATDVPPAMDGASSVDAGTDIDSAPDVPVATDAPPADAVDASTSSDVAPADTGPMDTGPADSGMVVTDTPTVTDVPAATDVPVATDTPPADAGSASDYPAGTPCSLGGQVRTCAASNSMTCLWIAQYCDAASMRWTECFALQTMCAMPDAGTPDAGPTDAGMPDAGPPDSGLDPRYCPCTGVGCDLLMHCRTACNTDGVRTVGLYCSGAPCYGVLTPCPAP